ncbi:MAG: hypothetical protein EXS08_00260 [Planctomycetes bacterium]|nr:hypothetical protein [Planctomycetota bacterium]
MRTLSATWLLLLALPLATQLDRRAGEPPRPGPELADRRHPRARHPLSAADQARFERGRALFERDFHRSSGLGAPEMNADSCRGCHQDPVLGGAGGLELNVSRFARDNAGAGPFQNLPGGQGLSKLRPPYVAGREEYTLGEADVFEQRQTPSILGDGLIEELDAAVILANEDPLDADGDGIRGVARRLVIDGKTELGRFGWKAQVPTLSDFVRDALGGELGLTSPADARGFALTSDTDAHADPEIQTAEADDMAYFLTNLAAPERVGSLEPEVLLGELVFAEVGCAKCHVPELPGLDGPVPLFSDLLLHDVLPADFRGMSEPGAPAGSYRTPPLWGIRTSAPYLHDGRASTLRAAIALHAGEAHAVRKAFEARPLVERDALLAFLRDL